MELLWQNGQVVMQGMPSPKRPRDPHPHHMPDPFPPFVVTGDSPPIQQLNHHDPVAHPVMNDYTATPAPNNLFIQEDEMATWLLSDFCSDFLPPPPASHPVPTPPPAPPPPPPPLPPPPCGFESFSHFSRPSLPRTPATVVDSSDTPVVAGASENAVECRVVRVGDSLTRDLTVTSSSGTSSASTEPIPPMKIQNAAPPLPSQRKTTADVIVGGGEDVHLLPKEGKRPRVSSSTKRSRAAEVHNLSERRRRDRINEKMRALQELVPHSSKADKASMLNEAIEYLKSLQAQIQMMSMGCGTMPMFPYPGLQQYMPPMGMGMGMGMGLGMGMGMGLGMNQPTMQFPHVFPGSTPPTGGAGPLNCPRVCFPSSQIPPHIPAPNPSRVPPPNQPDSVMLSLVPPQNQPRMQGFLDPYQHFLGLQHAHSGMSSSAVATTSNVVENSQKT